MKLRDVKTHIFLGELCKHAGLKKAAVTSYKDALLLVPFALEVVEALVGLGVEAGEITATLDDAVRGEDGTAIFRSITWMHHLVNGLVAKRNFEHDRSMTSFQRVLTVSPKNAYLLSQMGELAGTDPEAQENAMVLFKQVRRMDGQLIVARMERYAKVLFRREDETEM
eukprot:gene36557-45084_t